MLRRVLVLLALLLPLTLVSATPASASATESEFVSRTNSARTSRSLRAYVVRSDLTAVARRQAARMASARRIYHNPNLTSEVGNWRAIGENVGVGGSVSGIHTAFMNSSAHRGNILSTSFTEVGIGTARGGDGQIYVSQVFRRPNGTTTYAPAPAPARRTPTPRATRTPTRRPAAVTRTTTTAPRRASRGAVRRPLPPVRRVVVVPKRPPVVVVNPLVGRLKSAWLLYRRERPVGSLDRLMTYSRTTQLLDR